MEIRIHLLIWAMTDRLFLLIAEMAMDSSDWLAIASIT